MLTGVTEKQATCDTEDHRREQTEQVSFWLTNTTVAFGVSVGDLVGENTAEQVDERRSQHDGHDSQTHGGELPAHSHQDGGTGLTSSSLDGDEEGVRKHDPDHVGEEHCSESVKHRNCGFLVLETVLEDTNFSPESTGLVGDGIDAGTGLAGDQGVDRFALEFLGRSSPSGLGKESQKDEPSEESSC